MQAEIEAILASALKALYDEQRKIIRIDVAERTLTSALVAILPQYFDNHAVHAEDNRHGILSKEIAMPDAECPITMPRFIPTSS